MNPYEARQEARRERLEARAERLAKESEAAFRRGDLREEVSGIPLGQPILVGHHSEKRHRAQIARAHRALDKGVALHKQAQAVAAQAASVGLGGISSDDPEAIRKLKEELAGHEAKHAQEKAINAAIRKHAKAGAGAQAHAIMLLGYSAALASKLLEHVPGHGVGIPAYRFSNRSANMRRIRERIAYLEKVEAQRAAMPEPVVIREIAGGMEIVENAEANRLQIGFPGKPPAAVIAALKSHGFKWAPSVGFWQRQLNNAAKWAAEQVELKWKEAQ